MTVRIRPAREDDRDFVLSLVPRLRAFGSPPLRPAAALDSAERDALDRALGDRSPDAALLLAEIETLGRAGVAYAMTAEDYFTHERHGHLSILAVAEAAEGHGVGSALLAAVEEWSHGRGHRFVTLNVFAENERARAVYERAGYFQDTIRYAKELTRDPATPLGT